MSRLRASVENFIQRQIEDGEDLSLAFERMGREIKGSIFLLLTVYQLVALTSYVPLDSLFIGEGAVDQVSNLGGFVGALMSQWLLGSMGLPGYFIVFVTGWMAFLAFRGKTLSNHYLKVMGITIGSVLASISCFLLFQDSYPEMSLMRGGWLGSLLGGHLQKYFNVTGALLVVVGAMLVSFTLSTGISISEKLAALFDPKDMEDDEELEEEEEAPRPRKVARKKAEASPSTAAKPKKKKAAKKKTKSSEDDEFIDDEGTDELDLSTLDANLDEGDELDSEAEASEGEEQGFQDMIPFSGSHTLPTVRLLKAHTSGAKKVTKGELKESAKKLKEHLLSFQVTGEIVDATIGPVLVTYEFKPSAGIKLSKIAALQDDLGVVMGTRELRIMAPIPGKTVVGIEVPRPKTEVISLKEIVSDDEFYSKKYKLPIALGKATDGRPVFGDLAAMPHLLVAGSTGSGKSVFVNTMIMSFLYRLNPQQLRMILIDPKMLELNTFDGIPHLMTNVITKPAAATNALNWAVEEMERRYDLMSKTGSKNIDSYNSKMKSASKKIPYLVIVVDELADLMMSGDRDSVETAITRLAQKARAAGIHLVIATQRPSTDVITGLIKANIPSRLSFKVPSAIDSRTVLDASGAQSLIGKGDSLMVRPAIPLQRIHGCFVSEEELARVVKHAKGGKKTHQSIYIKF